MDYLLYSIIIFILLIWWVRPIYNFSAKRKYQLLDLEKLTIAQRVQTWLPALLFYGLLVGLLFYPAITNNVIGATGTGTILVIQVLFLYIITRFDKRQTKYKIQEKGLRYRKKFIAWDKKYTVTYKASVFFILHKPRFILVSKDTKIVVPMLSHRIQQFINKVYETNHNVGEYMGLIYENARVYYVDNVELIKKLNKIK